MHTPDLSLQVQAGVERILATMQTHAPVMAGKAYEWMKGLSRTDSAAAYFQHIHGFPFLLLPGWLEKTFGQQPDPTLHADLIYSSMNGYYFVRMVDNIMDGHATVESALLPAASFFHNEFSGIYRRLFPARHPFWADFDQQLSAHAEVTVRDGLLKDKDEEAFFSLVSRKVGGAKIPLLAICHLREQPARAVPWLDFVDLFGRWHLFEEDLFDWHRDLANGVRTHFLCEGNRRKRPLEALEAWVLHTGFQWGVDILRGWMPEISRTAEALDSPDLLAYLAARVAFMEERVARAAPSLTALGNLLAVWTNKG